MLIRAKAPLRISFAGGGTNVSPYAEECGGVVLSATIDKYAYGSLRLRGDRDVSVRSLDYDIVAKYNVNETMKYDGELDLVKAVLNTLNRSATSGLDFLLHSDAPPGSGLGSSSTLVVALIGLMKHWQRLPLTAYDIAQLAYHIERRELGIQGGQQDQYAAAFGGFNFIEFTSAGVIVNPLRVNPAILNELEYNLLLCYTGRTRLSANIITTQIDNYRNRETRVLRAMEELKRLTVEMKNALLHGRLDDFGMLLHDAWLNKKKMAREITNMGIDALYDAARRQGALGGKILGAGGGGYLLVYCPFDRKHVIAAELENLGGQLVQFTFDSRGLQTWEVRNGQPPAPQFVPASIQAGQDPELPTSRYVIAGRI